MPSEQNSFKRLVLATHKVQMLIKLLVIYI